MQKKVLILLLIIVPIFSFGQRTKRYRWEVGIDIGAANFLGDLGGADQIGTHLAKDLEFTLTRTSLGAHMRYRKNRYLGFRGQFNYGRIFGNDALTQERFRHNRNLSFRSNIFETSGMIEFYWTKERPGHLYKYKKIKGWKNIDMQGYLFMGVGGFYYNPKSLISGVWYELRPLRTEGQGIKPGTKMYSRVAVCFPIGAGFKYGINRQWNIGLDIGLRYTTSDYIDDVSTVYYDKALIAAAQPDPNMGAVAAYFADPSLGLIPPVDNIYVTGVGQQRGESKHKDAYMFINLAINYKIGKFKKTHSKF
jgi:Domain of unknown function (DUF6089)